MSAATITPRWLNRPAAARYAGMSVRSIHRHMMAGAFDSRKVGGCRLIDRLSLDEWIQSHPSAATETNTTTKP